MRKMSRAGQVSCFIIVHIFTLHHLSDIGNLLLQQSDICSILLTSPTAANSAITRKFTRYLR